MIVAPISQNEDQRLRALEALHLLDTPAEERFDRITRITKRALDAPISYISLLGSCRQWFKSVQGLQITEIPRELSFCSHTILQQEALIVDDTLLDHRFHDNPFVVNEPRVRFYAGQPLKTPDGCNVGTICVVDQYPHKTTDDDRALLADLGRLAENELACTQLCQHQKALLSEIHHLQNEALIEPVTRMWTRCAIQEILSHQLDQSWKDASWLSVSVADIHFPEINEPSSSIDAMMREVANQIRSGLGSVDSSGRWSEREFLLVLPGANKESCAVISSHLQKLVSKAGIQRTYQSTPATLNVGAVSLIPGMGDTAESIIAAAENALFQAKLNAVKPSYTDPV